MAERRRAFWPTVVAGAAGAALAAVGAGQRWASADPAEPSVLQPVGDSAARGSEVAPLALALALVALAGWAALLVVRRRARVAVALVGASAAAGCAVATLVAGARARDAAVDDLVGSAGDASTSLTTWYVVTVLGAVLAGAAFVVALRWSRGWPEMARRYDAPGSREPATVDYWKSLDDGNDPTQ